jgi:hypothetical protein
MGYPGDISPSTSIVQISIRGDNSTSVFVTHEKGSSRAFWESEIHPLSNKIQHRQTKVRRP